VFRFFTSVELPLADNWFSSLASCQCTSKRPTASTIFLAAGFVVVVGFVFLWLLIPASGSSPQFLSLVHIAVMVFTDSRLHSPTLRCTGGFDLICVACNTSAFSCGSHTYWLSLQTVYKQQHFRKLHSFSPSFSLFIRCSKNKFHMQTRGWL